MAKYFYHPFGDNALSANVFSGSSHDANSGKLDIEGNHTPFYAMCDGEIVDIGADNQGNHYCVEYCENNALGMPFHIRYFHGSYEVSVGDYVKAGELIGYTGKDSPDHLHIDFTWGRHWDVPNDKGQSGYVVGTLNNDKTQYTISGKTFKLKSNLIDWNKINSWNTNGSTKYGYCWLVFGQTPKYLNAYEASGNSDKLKVTIDDYINKILVGLVAQECSWKDAATAQGILIVCRNWIYIDCNNKLSRPNLSFTKTDVDNKNAMAQHFSEFIKGKINWNQYSDWYNLSDTYISKKVSGTNMTALEFVKSFMNSGEHWGYIDNALSNKKATLNNIYSIDDIEDCNGFPQNKYTQTNQRVVLLPSFGDWLVNWEYYDGGSLIKPSVLLSTKTNKSILTVGKEVIDAHYTHYQNIGSPYYSNYYYLDTTIENKSIHSRRDCSGYICGVWQALGDLKPTQSLTTFTFVAQHPKNWELISLSSLNYDSSKLRPGDVIFREGATYGHGDGHTELIVSVNGNSIRTYALGSDDAMIASSTSINYLANNINHYDYILRRK